MVFALELSSAIARRQLQHQFSHLSLSNNLYPDSFMPPVWAYQPRREARDVSTGRWTTVYIIETVSGSGCFDESSRRLLLQKLEGS
ncbi:hypothetical protein E4U52_006868 [Claviceps spartinae]|nr:hypothetical protein E4U52_006868 [Claviceps spartinae]